MSREITVREVEKTLNEDINETILVKRENRPDVIIMSIEEYRKIFELNLKEKLKNAEKEIKEGKVVCSEVVFAEMREKYDYE